MGIVRKAYGSTGRNAWRRGLDMLLVVIAMSLAHAVLNAVTILQFIRLLLAGEPSLPLLHFGTKLSEWFAEAVRFLACASEERPFPWKE